MAFAGNGVSVTSAMGLLNNANQASPSPVTMYTAPSSGGGAKIMGIFGFTTATAYSAIVHNVYIIHGGVSYLVYIAEPTASLYCTGMNNTMLFTCNMASIILTSQWTLDENGQPYFILGAGDSIAIQNNSGIPAGGASSGNYYWKIQAQQF